jgi:hypothetical protein
VSDRPPAIELAAPVERYVDARELADLMGVSTKTIERLRKQGMPSETWGLRHTRRYLPSQCIAWARGRSTTRTMARARDADCDVPAHHQRQAKE